MIFLATIDILLFVCLQVALCAVFFQLGRVFELGKKKAVGRAMSEFLVNKIG